MYQRGVIKGSSAAPWAALETNLRQFSRNHVYSAYIGILFRLVSLLVVIARFLRWGDPAHA